MKKLFIMLSLIILVLLVSACGTSDEDADAETAGSKTGENNNIGNQEKNETNDPTDNEVEEDEPADPKETALKVVADQNYDGALQELEGIQLMEGTFLVSASEEEQYLVVNGVILDALERNDADAFWNKVKDFDQEDIVEVPKKEEKSDSGDSTKLGLDFEIGADRDEVLNTLGEPIEISSYNGGEALFYDDLAYIFDYLDKTMTAASIYSPEIKIHGTYVGMTPDEVQEVLGESSSDGIDEMTDQWISSYEFGEYVLHFYADSNKKPVNEILYIKKFEASDDSGTNFEEPATDTAVYDLEIFDVQPQRSSSAYYTVDFKVRNNTNYEISRIDIKVTFYDVNGNPLTSEESYINSIPALEYKPDEVMIQHDENIDTFNIEILNYN